MIAKKLIFLCQFIAGGGWTKLLKIILNIAMNENAPEEKISIISIFLAFEKMIEIFSVSYWLNLFVVVNAYITSFNSHATIMVILLG